MAYTVTFQPGGERLIVEAHQTLLGAALQHSIPVTFSCQHGSCGACRAVLVSGQIEYLRQTQSITPMEQAQNIILLCLAQPRSDIELRAVQSLPQGNLPKHYTAKVTSLERMAPEIMKVMLKLPEGESLSYKPGQYIDIVLADGRRRAFSLANAPQSDGLLELHIRHIPGGVFTGHVFEQMQVKEIVRFYGPLGTFSLQESTRPILMVGGGAGFAPLKAMLEHAFAYGVTNPITLYWGVRTHADLYFHENLRRWQGEYPNFFYTPVLSDPLTTDYWQGQTGWVHSQVVLEYADLSAYDLYLSGPPPMVESAKTTFLARGLPPERLFIDSFEFGADIPK